MSALPPEADMRRACSESPLCANSGHLIMVLLGSEKTGSLTVAKELVAEVALALAVVVARAAVPGGLGMLSWKPSSTSRLMIAR